MTRRSPAVFAVALAAGACLGLPGCSRRDAPEAPEAPAIPAAPSSSPASSASPAESGVVGPARVRVEPTSKRARVFDLPFRAVDVAAGAAPSRDLPLGTLVLAKVADEGFALVEWDPAAGRTIREVTHLHQPGSGVQVGNVRSLTRAGSGFAYATTGHEDPSPIELWIVGPDLAKKHHRVIDVPTVDARRLSLHGSGETLVLSYCAGGEHHVATFDVPSGAVVGRRKLGRKLALCVGFTTPLADARVVGSSIWSITGGVGDYEVLMLGRDLRRVLQRRPIPTPGLSADARASAIDEGDFPRFDATPSRMAWNTRGELRVSKLDGATPIWKGRVDPTSISTDAGEPGGPQENDFPIAVDPETAAALLGDGTWYAADGAATRVFRAHEEQPALAPVPVQHQRRVTFSHGRGVFLGVSPEAATLVLVEPE